MRCNIYYSRVMPRQESGLARARRRMEPERVPAQNALCSRCPSGAVSPKMASLSGRRAECGVVVVSAGHMRVRTARCGVACLGKGVPLIACRPALPPWRMRLP